MACATSGGTVATSWKSASRPTRIESVCILHYRSTSGPHSRLLQEATEVRDMLDGISPSTLAFGHSSIGGLARGMRFALAIALAAAISRSPDAYAESSSTLPRQHHHGAITWMSGGIGKDQAEAMRKVAARYNVRVTMAQARKPSAAFLALVPVKISDAKGKVVLSLRSEGPFLFLKLPPGRYKLSAQFAGKTQNKSVQAKKG